MLAQPNQTSFFSCAAPSRIQSAKNTPGPPLQKKGKVPGVYSSNARSSFTRLAYLHAIFEKRVFVSAPGRGRTGTSITRHGILSPRRLPIPPLRHIIKDGADFLSAQTTQIGLEPTASAVTGRRSNQLSHWALLLAGIRSMPYQQLQSKNGPSGTRTQDRSVMSRLL